MKCCFLLKIAAACTIVFAAGSSSAQEQKLSLDKEQKEILSVVLTHFGARKDASFYSKKGQLLLDPRKPFGISGAANSKYWNGKCDPGAELRSKLVDSVIGQWLWGALPAGPGWEFMSPEHAARGNFLEPPRDARGVVAKTVIRFSPPVLTQDGTQALVDFEFRWSIHGAHAWYLLSRRSNEWSIQCSELQFFI